MGTSGTCARMARNAAPDKNAWRSPSGVREPSGNTNNGIPDRSALTPPLRLDSVARGLSASTGIWPDRFKYHPMKGKDQSSFLARIRNWKGSAEKTTGVSMYEV